MSHESPDEWYSYAIIRVVPRVEREEFVNAGVVLFVPTSGILRASFRLDRERLRALDDDVDLETLEKHLRVIHDICEGDADAGPIAELPASERFHWLTAPRSAVIQVSPVHAGRTADLDRTIDQLLERYVTPPGRG